MSHQEPTGPYVFQPYGMINEPYWLKGEIYGVGIPGQAPIKGLSKHHAELICTALRKAAALDYAAEHPGMLYGPKGDDPLWTYAPFAEERYGEGSTPWEAIEAADKAAPNEGVHP